jgi:hypothetical protein
MRRRITEILKARRVSHNNSLCMTEVRSSLLIQTLTRKTDSKGDGPWTESRVPVNALIQAHL